VFSFNLVRKRVKFCGDRGFFLDEENRLNKIVEMKAMVLEIPGQDLQFRDVEVPEPDHGQFLIRVEACAVCRTDLHVFDGELKHPKLPLIPGHEVVGKVIKPGPGAAMEAIGTRVGVPWMGSTCGTCSYCRRGTENLCDSAKFTGYTLDGGYAEYLVADESFCIPIPDSYSAVKAAPLLCAGLIGYRSLVMTGPGQKIGIYGFGAAAHIICQVAIFQGKEIYAFTRPGDSRSQEFALSLGAVWAGDSDQPPPVVLDSAIIFAPVGQLVPTSLRSVRKGGVVVCGGIYMTDIPSFPYDILWGERQIKSVANLTRKDAVDFMEIAPKVPVETTVIRYSLRDANQALTDLREGRLEGAAVLIP
jgi:propanol-preferring alcohol dehydrogenase